MIYEIAGLRVLIKNEYPYTDSRCRAYLSSDQTSPVDLTTVVTEEEREREQKEGLRPFNEYEENICLYRNLCMQLPRFSRIFLHCAVVSYQGEGYAFLGKSGVGKSTHTGLWVNYLEGAKILNGDKPIIEKTEGGFIAHGTPWNGKEDWGIQSQAPLRALCFIEQAEKNEIRRLTSSECFKRLLHQVLMPSGEKDAAATLEIMDSLITSLPSYLLRCDISEKAVQTSFEEITGLSYEEKKK